MVEEKGVIVLVQLLEKDIISFSLTEENGTNRSVAKDLPGLSLLTLENVAAPALLDMGFSQEITTMEQDAVSAPTLSAMSSQE